MSYIPKNCTVSLTEDDVSELKSLLETIELEEFRRRGSFRRADSNRTNDHLHRALLRIIQQIPRS